MQTMFDMTTARSMGKTRRRLFQFIIKAITVETELYFTPLCTSCAHDVHDNRASFELRCATHVQNEVHLFCDQSFIEVHFLHVLKYTCTSSYKRE